MNGRNYNSNQMRYRSEGRMRGLISGFGFPKWLTRHEDESKN